MAFNKNDRENKLPWDRKISPELVAEMRERWEKQEALMRGKAPIGTVFYTDTIPGAVSFEVVGKMARGGRYRARSTNTTAEYAIRYHDCRIHYTYKYK